MALKDKYFTISEAAEEAGVTRQTISRWIAEGKLPAEKIGREKLIEKDAFRQFRDYELKWLVRNIVIREMVKVIREKCNLTNKDKVTPINPESGSPYTFSINRQDGTSGTVRIKVGKITFEELKGGGAEILVEIKGFWPKPLGNR